MYLETLEKANMILSAIRLVSGNQSKNNVELTKINQTNRKVKLKVFGFFEQTMTPEKV